MKSVIVYTLLLIHCSLFDGLNHIEYVCEDIISEEEDRITGNRSKFLKESIFVSEKVGANGVRIYLSEAEGVVIIQFVVIGAGDCIDDDEYTSFLFRDGTRIELDHLGEANCNRKFFAFLGDEFGTENELIQLKYNEIEAMRVWTSNGYVEVYPTTEESKLLKAAFSCLTK